MVVEIDEALYWCIQSALLWFKELAGHLRSIGFTAKAYEIFNRDTIKAVSP
jgi:hypothetical protein